MTQGGQELVFNTDPAPNDILWQSHNKQMPHSEKEHRATDKI